MMSPAYYLVASFLGPYGSGIRPAYAHLGLLRPLARLKSHLRVHLGPFGAKARLKMHF